MLQQIVCIIENESCSRSICRVLKLILNRISDLSVVRKRNRGCKYRGLWMEGVLRLRQQAGGLATKGRNGAEITLVLNVGKWRLILHHWRFKHSSQNRSGVILIVVAVYIKANLRHSYTVLNLCYKCLKNNFCLHSRARGSFCG